MFHIKKDSKPSIKEGMDNMPYGIAFAGETGIVILCNHAMHSVCASLLGMQLQNAELFWKHVTEQGEKTPEGAYILRIGDGRAYLLMRRPCDVNGSVVYELTAQDVTERFGMIERLEDDNRRLENISQRLRRYNDDALELVRSKELLARKEYIHDELGRLLSATRHYLDGGDVDSGELWQRWNINAALLLDEAIRPSGDGLLGSLRKAADAVGVKLIITGDDPQGSLTAEFMLAAGGECLTNLLRHTKGNELYIRIERKDGADMLYFTNNGEAPENEIAEGGGLSALRRKVEDVGGVMDVISQPVYELILTVPVVWPEG